MKKILAAILSIVAPGIPALTALLVRPQGALEVSAFFSYFAAVVLNLLVFAFFALKNAEIPSKVLTIQIGIVLIATATWMLEAAADLGLSRIGAIIVASAAIFAGCGCAAIFKGSRGNASKPFGYSILS